MSEIEKAYRTKIRVFEGAFRDAGGVPTCVVRWATRSASLPDGPVEGRLRVSPRTSYGIGEAVAAVPERCQATLELLNGDRALSPFIVGTNDGRPENEYRGDSFLNLKGKLFAYYLRPDGTYEKQALTPLLACSGSPTFTETTITVPMASDDSRVLGKVATVVRVGQLREAMQLAPGDCVSLATGAAMTLPGWGQVQLSITDNLDAVIPYAYGRVAIPWVPMCGDGKDFFALFASVHRPSLSFAKKWLTWHGQRSRKNTLSWAAVDPPRLCSYQVRVTDEDDKTHDVWVVLVQKPERVVEDGWFPDGWDDVFTLPPQQNLLSAYKSGRSVATPTRIAQWIVEDLSEAGADGIHAASFDAAERALLLPGACGGLITGESTIGESLTNIGEPWALSWWVGLDDKLHVGVPGQWSAADAAALEDVATPRITPADFAGGYGSPGSYEETIPADAEARGAAVRKLSLEWHELQQRAWPVDQLPRWAPGATDLPVQPGDEAQLSASWIYPPAAIDVLASGGARRCFPTRRVTLYMHDWIGVLERGSIALLSMPLAAPGAYVERALRLEHTADDEREYVVARFEDLGPAAAARRALFDSIENWVAIRSDPSKLLMVSAGSTRVTCNLGMVRAEHVGMQLHTPGSVSPANRAIARRIVAVPYDGAFDVDFPFAAAETLYGSPAGTPALDSRWYILESQETRPENDTYLTACDETTGAFRDGSPGFTVSAG